MTTRSLRVCLLGRFMIEGELTGPAPTGKAQRLLKILVARHGEFVPVHVLIDALWRTDRPERADRNVAALVSRLRRSLGRERIDGGPTGYRLVLDDLAVDLFEAEQLVATAERELAHRRYALAASSAERATRMLQTGPPLADEPDADWADDLRRHADRELRRARAHWWTAALALGANRDAIDVASAALWADPLDEEACRAAIIAHQREGESAAALLAYKSLRTALAEQLGSDPAPATQALFLSVLRAENPATSGRRRPPLQEAGAPRLLVGREAELATLDALWTGVVSGGQAMALVVGEAGIGKSALATSFAAQAHRTGALVLTTACFEAERSLYLQPLVEAVRTAIARLSPPLVRELAADRLGTLIELVPEVAELTAAPPYERVGPELEHRRSLGALTEFLERLSESRPVLLVIEDCQHAGQSTVEALHFLASHWGSGRLMVLAVERTTEEPAAVAPLRELATWMELGPLSREAVGSLVRDSRLPYDVDQLYAWTGGSPLFATELLRQPVRTPAPGQAPTPAIPGSLAEAVAERLGHAGEDVTGLLAQGAVLGTAFSVDEVADLSGLPIEECATRAARALRANLLVSDGERFRFANDVVRRVAYDSVPEPIRISRHRRAAKLASARPEAAARHLVAAGDWTAAAQAWMLAGHAAHLAFANHEAEELLTAALDAALRSGDDELLATVRLRRGEVRAERGRHDEARADHEAALELARDLGDEELEARALEQLGWTALYARDAFGAVHLAEQARQLSESAAAAPGALPSALLLVGRVRHWDGDYDRAGSAYEEVLDGEPGDTTKAIALAYRGALLQHMDRFAEARATLEQAARLCRRTGQFRPLLQALFFTGLARGDTGDFQGALRSLNRARQLIDRYQVSFYRAGIDTTTSWLWQELGNVGAAREHAERAVELAHRGGGALELEQELHALLALADCDLLMGRTDDAAVRVEQAAPMLERSLPFRPRAAMRLLEMRARWDGDYAEALLIQARTYSSTKYEALALHHLGRPEEAAAAAARTGSDLVVAQLGAPADSRAALGRIAAALPGELRSGFASSGRLCRPSLHLR